MLFNMVLAFMMFITVPSLTALGERRLDVYICMFTLEYFVALAVLRPRRRFKDILALTLFIAFTVIVSIRVLEVLGVEAVNIIVDMVKTFTKS